MSTSGAASIVGLALGVAGVDHGLSQFAECLVELLVDDLTDGLGHGRLSPDGVDDDARDGLSDLTKRPAESGRGVREALSHVVDVDQLGLFLLPLDPQHEDLFDELLLLKLC